jgi:hypothetical protein
MRKIICLTVVSVVILVSSVFASNMQSIGKDRVKVRSKPNINSAVVSEAFLGYPLRVEKQQKKMGLFY